MASVKITKENFEQEVLKSEKTVIVDFWAPWCGPCKMLTPIIEEIAETEKDIKVCKVNCDDEITIAQKYRVASIPTLVVIKNGEEVTRSIGLKNRDQIMELVK